MMGDISEIIGNLAGYGLDAIKARDAEIAQLRAELATADDWRVVAEAGEKEIERLNAELARLRASYDLACEVIDEYTESPSPNVI